jgi:DNA polymerase-3 subunit delta'
MNIYDLITQAIQSGKASHAYIIIGGNKDQKSLADFIARGVNCLKGAGRPCGACSSCRKIGEHNHPDVSVIEPEGTSIGIDPIRKLQREVYIKPYEGKKRVSVICQGDKMTVQAQNCLLKILEEPPGTGIILICSAGLGNLLPTVISRCQTLRMDAEESAFDSGLYREVIGRLLEPGFTQVQEITDMVLKDADRSVEGFLDYLLMQIRDIIALKVARDRHLLYIKEGGDFTQRIASRFTLARLGKLADAVSKAREALKFNANAQLTMEVLLLEIQEV